jgi:hypothetical protein
MGVDVLCCILLINPNSMSQMLFSSLFYVNMTEGGKNQRSYSKLSRLDPAQNKTEIRTDPDRMRQYTLKRSACSWKGRFRTGLSKQCGPICLYTRTEEDAMSKEQLLQELAEAFEQFI